MNAYFACGLVVAARRVFDEIQGKDVVAWTGMVSGYVDSGLFLRGVEVFREMKGCEEPVRPNVATVVSVASACAGLGSLEFAEGLHAYVEKVGLEGELMVANALIDMHGKCGGIELAHGLFGLMPQKDLHSWTAMISGLASHGHGKEAVALFMSMREAGVLPDSTTFVVVLSACSHAGLVDEGISIFSSMESEYKVTPDIKHYGCMVDLFSRAGLIARAYQFIDNMPFEPNLAILGALLSACSINNELDIGELVIKRIESKFLSWVLDQCFDISTLNGASLVVGQDSYCWTVYLPSLISINEGWWNLVNPKIRKKTSFPDHFQAPLPLLLLLIGKSQISEAAYIVCGRLRSERSWELICSRPDWCNGSEGSRQTCAGHWTCQFPGIQLTIQDTLVVQ
ncbi:hypothetical protein GUJ93_ZPchr0002g26364 [Zizania palustris]|uniref:Pentatricopeptide repeat-containing protein n=1 Tax=Zizania palustris TaxID=103762 RepID=A0A8J5S4Z6_ZIZPA|nr:hypothetical protein GUJ93_ZPchr0002g26364 [Zizania palustris]